MLSLKELELQHVNNSVWRLQSPPTFIEDEVRASGLDSESQEELRALFSHDEPDPLAIFDEHRFSVHPQRFSNGSYPVWYTSLETLTAVAEVKHWVGVSERAGRKIWKTLFKANFVGDVKDLRPKLKSHPEFVSDDYALCNLIGLEAYSENLDGLLAPSARHTEGTNLPIFTKKCVVMVEPIKQIGFQVDNVTGDVMVTGLSAAEPLPTSPMPRTNVLEDDEGPSRNSDGT